MSDIVISHTQNSRRNNRLNIGSGGGPHSRPCNRRDSGDPPLGAIACDSTGGRPCMGRYDSTGGRGR